MATYRARHWTDTPHPSLAQRRRRRIGNHLNYVSPGGILLPTQAAVSVAPGAPPNWSGQFDFRDQSIAAPLQFFAHDATDPGNRAMVGVRIDDTPDIWVNIKADGVQTGVETQTVDDITREWPGLWTNSTLRWIHGGHKAQKEIVLSAPGHPDYFDFLIRISPGASFEFADNVYRVRDAQGEEKILSRAPYGWDSSVDADGLGGANIRGTLTYLGTEGPGGRYHRVRLTPNPDDLAGAVYPVTLDPTTTISGTGSIEENQFRGQSGYRNTNYGGSGTSFIYEASALRRWILRIDETLIPSGVITQFDFNWTSQRTTGINTLEAYQIKPANQGWVEGTANGTAQTGSSCWDYYAYDASTPTSWAGGGGFIDGTDYFSNASPPSLVGPWTANVGYTWNLGSDGNGWATDWRDTPSNNAGWFIQATSGNITGWYTSENPTYPPSYDIEYNLPGGAPGWVRWTPPHVAGRNALFRGSF